MAEQDEDSYSQIGRRTVWSGTISFGLVSIPVEFLTTNRSTGVAMRMVSDDATPLQKVYYCSEDGKKLDNEHIIRGYQTRPDHFVPVTDEELDALAPEKSNDISLELFAPREQLNPKYFDKSYYLIPAKRSSARPFHLLVSAMEKTGVAGIASFVMRGKEYVVAILSVDGILHAETLRFSGEIRSAADLDLPTAEKVDKKLVKAFKTAIEEALVDELPVEQMRNAKDLQLEKLREQYAKKMKEKSGKKKEKREPLQPDSNVYDIIGLIEERLGKAKAQTETAGPKKTKAKKTSDLADKTKDDLYKQAQDLGIEGRSKMTKDELLDAIQDAI